MSTFRFFTPQQQKLFQHIGDVHPEQWLRDQNEYLRSEHTVEELDVHRTLLIDHQKMLLDIQAALPPKHMIGDYITSIQSSEHPPHHTALIPSEVGPQHLDLPSDDVANAVFARYETLERLLVIASECLVAIDAVVLNRRNLELLPPEVTLAIDTLPTTSRSERLDLATVLASRSGTITLAGYAKKDAAIVLNRLQGMMATYGSALTTADRKRMHIECKDAKFCWYDKGPKGGKARDQVYHIANQITTKPSPTIEPWLKEFTV